MTPFSCRQPLLAASLVAALCIAAPGHAQVVQFLGVPTAAEILEVLAGSSGDDRDRPELRSGQTARIIRDEPVLTAAPPAGTGTAAPAPGAEATAGPDVTPPRARPAHRRPTSARALALADNFAPKSTRLPPRTVALLDSTAEAMRRATGINILISGHTDSNGSAVSNAVLSLGRAEAAAQYLLLRGIEPGRIVITGAGSSQPLPGTQPTAPDNRRIQVAVTSRSDHPQQPGSELEGG